MVIDIVDGITVDAGEQTQKKKLTSSWCYARNLEYYTVVLCETDYVITKTL